MEPTSQLEDALEAALALYEVEDESALRARLGADPTTHVIVRDGRRFDAQLVALLILEASDSRGTPAARDRDLWHAVLQAAGAHVIALSRWTVADERRWRLDAWEAMQSRTPLTSRWLRGRALLGGQQGVWVDKLRTRHLAPEGVAVSVLHTGRHYADDLHKGKILYSYPHTSRPPARDANEIAAVKNAGELGLPLFVIAEAPGGARVVELAWVVAYDDSAEAFLMEFAEAKPNASDFSPPDESAPFTLTGSRPRRHVEREIAERDPEFKFRVLRRYESACAVTGVAVTEVLDAAHVVPVDEGGTDDERNGLLLTATLHRALDAHLWAIEPKTLRLVTRRSGPTLADLHVDVHELRNGAPPPHPEAVDWRYRRFRKKTSKPIDETFEELDLKLA